MYSNSPARGIQPEIPSLGNFPDETALCIIGEGRGRGLQWAKHKKSRNEKCKLAADKKENRRDMMKPRYGTNQESITYQLPAPLIQCNSPF
jgi:hypothetical protein